MAARKTASISSITSTSLYRELRRYIARAKPGDRLTPERQLAAEHGIGISLVRRILQQLVDEGLIEKVHGKGNLVTGAASKVVCERGTIVFADAWAALDHPFYARKLQGVLEVADELDYRVEIVCILAERMPKGDRLSNRISHPDVVGMIYPFGQHRYMELTRDRRPDMPIVCDIQRPSVSNTAFVSMDMFEIGCKGATALFGRGAKSLLALTANEQTKAGVRAAAAGTEDDIDVHDGALEKTADAAAVMAMVRESGCDALLFDEDRRALPVLEALRSEVPDLWESLHIACHANAGDEILPPSVIRLEIDGRQIGQLSVRVLDQLISGAGFQQTSVLVSPRVIMG